VSGRRPSTVDRRPSEAKSHGRRWTVDGRPTLAIALACALAAVACAPAKPKESRIAHDVRIIKEENKPEVLFERAKQFQQLGDLTRAEQYYAAAMQEGYPEEKVLPPLLRVCIDSNRYRVALDYAEPVLKKKPRDHKLRLLIASLYTAIGEPENARKHYEVVVTDAPDDATGHFAYAVLLRDEFKDRVEADKHFREYLRLDPKGPHVEEAKGSLLKEVTPPPTPLPPTNAKTTNPDAPKKLP
jgi:tetratricopeptide (TPR) repeat protein